MNPITPATICEGCTTRPYSREHIELMEDAVWEATRVATPPNGYQMFSASPRSGYAALTAALQRLATFRAESDCPLDPAECVAEHNLTGGDIEYAARRDGVQ